MRRTLQWAFILRHSQRIPADRKRALSSFQGSSRVGDERGFAIFPLFLRLRSLARLAHVNHRHLSTQDVLHSPHGMINKASWHGHPRAHLPIIRHVNFAASYSKIHIIIDYSSLLCDWAQSSLNLGALRSETPSKSLSVPSLW